MLAILYDVHGNLAALEAVIDDATARGADAWLLGGDYAAMGLRPAETVARLEALGPVAMLRGNWERWTARPGEGPAAPVAQSMRQVVVDALGAATVARHGALPATVEHAGVLFCHASPRSDVEGFATRDADPAEDERLLDGAGARRVIAGHTHEQYARTTATGVEVANPGSVGLPCDGDHRAGYALLGEDGSLALHRVPYDHEAVAAELDAVGAPWAATTAARLRAARLAP